MKKLLLFGVALLATTLLNAQETDAGQTERPVILFRTGQMYYYGQSVMDQKAYTLFLQQKCPAAYQQFRRGYNTSIAGWVLLSAGVGLTVGSTAAMIVDRYNELKRREEIRKNDPNAFYESHFPFVGMLILGVGVGLEIASIPTLCVGYSRMHNSVDVFNANCAAKMTVRPYWSLNASGNGIGLAYNF